MTVVRRSARSLVTNNNFNVNDKLIAEREKKERNFYDLEKRKERETNKGKGISSVIGFGYCFSSKRFYFVCVSLLFLISFF